VIVGCTGHRPDKLGGYSLEATRKLVGIAEDLLVGLMPTEGGKAISGMALGWDQAFAYTAVELGYYTIAAVPFVGQERRWPKDSRDAYQRLLDRVDEVVIVSPGEYAGWKFQRRNEWIVDRSDKIAAMWDGTSGGTANCLMYAASKGLTVDNGSVVNLYQEWL